MVGAPATGHPLDMNSTTHIPEIRRLQRSRSDRKVAGVAGGLASYFEITGVRGRRRFGLRAAKPRHRGDGEGEGEGEGEGARTRRMGDRGLRGRVGLVAGYLLIDCRFVFIAERARLLRLRQQH